MKVKVVSQAIGQRSEELINFLRPYEVRSYTGWYKHMTLCLLALHFLSKLKDELNQVENKKKLEAVT